MNFRVEKLMRTESFLEKIKQYKILDYDFKLIILLVGLAIALPEGTRKTLPEGPQRTLLMGLRKTLPERVRG